MRGPDCLLATIPILQFKNELVDKLRHNFQFSNLVPNNKSSDLPPHLKKIVPAAASKEFLE